MSETSPKPAPGAAPKSGEAPKPGAAPKSGAATCSGAAVPSARVLAVLLGLTGLVTVLYWVLYFTTGAVQAETSAVYIAFENSFPAADGWMSLACFLGAAGLWLRRHWGLLFSLCAGSAMIFLGLMDVLFNLENGMYAVIAGEMAFEILINVWTLGFGAFLLAFLWPRRRLYAD